MLQKFTLFGAVCLAICLPMAYANCGEEENSCQKRVLELCGQTVRDACAKVGTSSCMDKICEAVDVDVENEGCGSVACQQVKKCRTEAQNCVDECMDTGDWENMFGCIGWGR